MVVVELLHVVRNSEALEAARQDPKTVLQVELILLAAVEEEEAQLPQVASERFAEAHRVVREPTFPDVVADFPRPGVERELDRKSVV